MEETSIRMGETSIRTGENNVRMVFGTSKNVAEPVMFGTSHIDEFVKGISLTKRKIVQYNLHTMRVLMSHKASADILTTTRTANVTDGSLLSVEQKNKNVSCVYEEQSHCSRCPKRLS